MKRFIDLARKPEVATLLKDVASNPVVRESAATVAGMLFEALRRRGEASAGNVQKTILAQSPVDDIESVEDDPDLATVGEIQEQIEAVERVTVAFRHKSNLRDVRNDRRALSHILISEGLAMTLQSTTLSSAASCHLCGSELCNQYHQSRWQGVAGGTKLRNARA